MLEQEKICVIHQSIIYQPSYSPSSYYSSATMSRMQQAVSRVLMFLPSWVLGLVDFGFVALNRLLPTKKAKFFGDGYGNLSGYRKQYIESTSQLQNGSYKLTLTDKDIDWGKTKESSTVTIQEGRFRSPVADNLPKESAFVKFRLVRPADHLNDSTKDQVYIIMLPATGEAGSSVRLAMAKHLAEKYGYCSFILTAPYYGERKPAGQTLFFLSAVSDILFQAQGIIEEAVQCAAYIMKQSPRNKIVFTGFSYGAAMTGVASTFALAAGLDGQRIGSALYVGSASPCVLADGVLQYAIDLENLAKNELEAPGEAMRQKLFQELYITQLDDIQAPKENRLKVAKGIAMKHDHFIKPRYSLEFEEQIQTCLYDSYRLRWLSGGHAFAAFARPLLHQQLIIDTAQELVKS